MPVPFKIYDFECVLPSTLSKEVNNSDKKYIKATKIHKNIHKYYTKIYQGHILCSFAYKVVCVDNKFSKDVVIYTRKNAAYKFIEEILEEYKYCRKVIKNILTKILCLQKKKKSFN